MTNTAAVCGVKVSAVGDGVGSHVGAGLLREGRRVDWAVGAVTAVLVDTDRGPGSMTPGALFADLVAAVADRADCGQVAQLWGDREHVFGAVASIARCGGCAMSASTPPGCRGFGRHACLRATRSSGWRC